MSATPPPHGGSKKLGRPPASVGDLTRLRILDAARTCFSDSGYDGTTTRQIAEVAELTTAAIYHYYRSKSELYREALVQTHLLVYSTYQEAIRGCQTLADEFAAVLVASQALNRDHPSLARFLVAARADSRRHPELDPPADAVVQRGRFHHELVDRAVLRGEVAAEDALLVTETLRTLLGGIVYYASDDLEFQAMVVEGVLRLLKGTLLTRKH